MSMISAQINELRELALWLDDEFYDAEATKVRDAADTIWQLRDDLQRANAENAKLREYIERKQDLQHFARLVNENSKLRKLCADMWACISHIGEYDAFYYDMAKDGCGISCTINGEHCCADKLYDRMCKLGVEVDG